MASVAPPSILWNKKARCTDCDKKFNCANNNLKVCPDCLTKRVKERKAMESTSPTRVPGQLSPSSKSKQASRYQPLSNLRVDQASKSSFKMPNGTSGMKVKRSADNLHDGKALQSIMKAPRLSDSVASTKGILTAAFEEYEKNPSHSVPSSPTSGSKDNLNDDKLYTSSSKDSQPNKGFVMIDLTKESDKSEDEMPMYVAVVKAESIEEHVDTQPPSQNIYPVTILQDDGQGISLPAIPSASINDNAADAMDTSMVSTPLGSNISSEQASVGLNLQNSVEICGGIVDSNPSTIVNQQQENMIETSGDAEAQMANSAVSKETVQVVDQIQTRCSFETSIPLAEPSSENLLNGSKDSGIMDTSETILDKNTSDSPSFINAADKPISESVTDDVISLIVGGLKKSNLLGLEQLKSQEEELKKELLERYPEDVFSAEIKRENDIIDQLSLKLDEDRNLQSSKEKSLVTKNESATRLRFLVNSCREERDTLVNIVKEIGSSAAQFEKLKKELEEAKEQTVYTKSLVASAESDLSEVIRSCLERFEKKKVRITEELNQLISFRRTEESKKSELAEAEINFKKVEGLLQTALEGLKEEENECALVNENCTKICLEIDQSKNRVSELKKSFLEMCHLKEMILTSEYVRKLKEIAIKRQQLLAMYC